MAVGPKLKSVAETLGAETLAKLDAFETEIDAILDEHFDPEEGGLTLHYDASELLWLTPSCRKLLIEHYRQAGWGHVDLYLDDTHDIFLFEFEDEARTEVVS